MAQTHVPRVLATWLAFLVPTVISTAAPINLEWRPLAKSAASGGTVRIGLYAVCDGAVNVPFNSAQVVITWDPTLLQLTGLDQAGAVNFSTSAFIPNDSYGFNESSLPGDGSGIWFGFVPLGSSDPATPAGTLLVTLVFQTLAPTAGTPVSALDSAQAPGHPVAYTQIMSGTSDALGTLSPPSIVTVGSSPAVCRGDTNCDGQISYVDINPFVQALDNLSAWQAQYPTCPWQNCDVNGDNVVSYADINPFVALLNNPGPCR